MTIVWMWRAWNRDRSRICDCGTAFAADSQTAGGIALAAAGGPHRQEIESIDLDPVAFGHAPDSAAARALGALHDTIRLTNH